MEQAIDFIANTEFVDVTPLGLRLRKRAIAANRRPGTRRCPSPGGTLSRQSRLKLRFSCRRALLCPERQAVRSIAGLPVRLGVDGMANRGRVLLDSLKVRTMAKRNPRLSTRAADVEFFQDGGPLLFVIS